MRKFLSIALLSLMCLSLSAQNWETPAPPNEISISGTQIVWSFFGPIDAATNPLANPTVLYRRHINKLSLRVGGGGNFRTSDLDSSDSTLVDHDGKVYALWVGLEGNTALARRWKVYFGADVMWGYQYSQYENLRDNELRGNEFKTIYQGARPFIGLRFLISPRLSLSVEGAFLAQIARESSTFRNENNDPPEITQQRNSFSVTYQSPQLLYFNFRF